MPSLLVLVQHHSIADQQPTQHSCIALCPTLHNKRELVQLKVCHSINSRELGQGYGVVPRPHSRCRWMAPTPAGVKGKQARWSRLLMQPDFFVGYTISTPTRTRGLRICVGMPIWDNCYKDIELVELCQARTRRRRPKESPDRASADTVLCTHCRRKGRQRQSSRARPAHLRASDASGGSVLFLAYAWG